MYKLGNIPSIKDDISEIADFLEIKCLFSEEGIFSIESAKNALSVESDELHFEGIDDDDDRTYNRLMEVFAELKQRKNDCNDFYPFIINNDLISFNNDCKEEIAQIYKYLLFATRANMKNDRLFGEGKDATLIFEILSQYICKSYFGNKSISMVFGTATEMTFKDKVKELIKQLNYKSEVKEPVGSNGKRKDGKLDVIVWNPFKDKRDSMLIGMAQCKTGTHWDDTLTQLQPSNFFRNYMYYSPIAEPVRLFFITESLAVSEQWEERARNAGILFDRQRIMSLLPQEIDKKLLIDIEEWNTHITQVYNPQ